MLKQVEDTLFTEKTERLDTRVRPVVRIIHGSLDEDPLSPQSIILHGRLDSATLRFLKADSSYQRPLDIGRKDIWAALKAGVVVPNIDVGVRGQNFETDGDDYLIIDPAYIIDGWQRVGNAMALMEAIPGHPIRMFATIHFDTNELWERHRFTELNKNVKKISPNLHLRNMRDGNEAILTLFGLSNNTPGFALRGRVCWSQNMHRDHLISAKALATVGMYLHAHQTGLHPGKVDRLAEANAGAVKKVSLNRYRQNIQTFFDVIEECWGIRNIEHQKSAPQMKQTFMTVLARIFSDHLDFWNEGDRIFFVAADLRRKLASLNLNEPHVQNLAGSGGKAGSILRSLIIEHINSGKRNKRLRHRLGERA